MEQDVAGRVLGDAIQCTYLNLETTLFQSDVVALLPRESAERYKAIPVYKFGSAVTVAMTNPQDTRIVAALSRLRGPKLGRHAHAGLRAITCEPWPAEAAAAYGR